MIVLIDANAREPQRATPRAAPWRAATEAAGLGDRALIGYAVSERAPT